MASRDSLLVNWCVRLTVALVAVLVPASCQSAEGDAASEESPTPTSAFVAVSGKLSTFYLMAPGECREVALGGIEGTRAQSLVQNVEGKTIDFRDTNGSVVGSAITPTNAELTGTGQRQGRYELCLATGGFSVQLPRADSYAITIRGILGRPEPVPLADLEARDLVCNLHIHTDGRVVEQDPCEGHGWVDAYA